MKQNLFPVVKDTDLTPSSKMEFTPSIDRSKPPQWWEKQNLFPSIDRDRTYPLAMKATELPPNELSESENLPPVVTQTSVSPDFL